MRSSVAITFGFGLGLAVVACGSTTSSTTCPPMMQIVGSGTLQIDRVNAGADTVTMYSFTTAQAEDLFNAGSLTIRAGDTVGGAGNLAVSAPVALVKMQPVSDDPATYDLTALKTQLAYCPSPSASLVVTNGALTGCSPSGTPVTVALGGTLTVMSSTSKSIQTGTPPGGVHFSLSAKYGTQMAACQ